MGKFNKRTKGKEKHLSEEAQEKFNPSSRHCEEDKDETWEDLTEELIEELESVHKDKKKINKLLERLKE